MLKRVIAACVCLILALSLAGCVAGEGASSSLPPVSSQPAAPSSAPPVSVASQPEEFGVKPMPGQDLDINYLTGEARPEDMTEGQRPVAVMVANNERALPQRGLAAADVLFEMVTEGGVTRLMAMYADYRTLPQVGPVRSSRDQFVQFALPANAILSQIGASVYARNLLTLLDYKVVDGLTLGTTAFWFDDARAHPKPQGKLNEYCWYTDAGLLWAGMEYLDVLTTAKTEPMFWFGDKNTPQNKEAYEINLQYSELSAAGFDYDADAGLYNKSIWGTPHTDEDGTPLRYTNVIVLQCPIGLKPDGQVTEFDLRGGRGYYFTAGGVELITWEKGEPGDALRLFGADGAMLQVRRGKSYVGVISENATDAILYLGANDPPPGPLE